MTPAERVNVLLLPQQWYVLHELRSGLGSGLLPALRGSAEHTKNESVAPLSVILLVRHAEPAVSEKTLLPCRSSRRIEYVPEVGAVICTEMAEAPLPLPLLSRVPSLGTGLK